MGFLFGGTSRFPRLPQSDLIKTGVRKELAPYRDDWYYVRAASIARKIYLRQGLGIAGLARVYGGAFRRGTRKQHFKRDSRGLIRHIVHQLEELGIVAKLEKGGRKLTKEGRKDLDRIAHSLFAGSEE